MLLLTGYVVQVLYVPVRCTWRDEINSNHRYTQTGIATLLTAECIEKYHVWIKIKITIISNSVIIPLQLLMCLARVTP